MPTKSLLRSIPRRPDLVSNFAMGVGACFWAAASACLAGAAGHSFLAVGRKSLKSWSVLIAALEAHPVATGFTIYWAVLALASLIALGRLANGARGSFGASLLIALVSVGILMERALGGFEIGVSDADRAALCLAFASLAYTAGPALWWMVLAPLLIASAIVPIAWLEFWRSVDGLIVTRASIPVALSIVFSVIIVVVRDARVKMSRAQAELRAFGQREEGLSIAMSNLVRSVEVRFPRRESLTLAPTESLGDVFENAPMTTVEVESPAFAVETATTSYQELQMLASEALEAVRAQRPAQTGLRLLLTAPADLSLPIAVRSGPDDVRAWMKSLVESGVDALGGGQGVVRVTLKPALTYVSLSVEDNGRGLGQDLHTKLGIDQTARLTWREVRDQVERVGGKFDLQSRLGVGSRVSLELSRVDTLSMPGRGARTAIVRGSLSPDSSSQHG